MVLAIFKLECSEYIKKLGYEILMIKTNMDL